MSEQSVNLEWGLTTGWWQRNNVIMWIYGVGWLYYIRGMCQNTASQTQMCILGNLLKMPILIQWVWVGLRCLPFPPAPRQGPCSWRDHTQSCMGPGNLWWTRIICLLNTHLPPSFGSRLWFSFGNNPLPVLSAPVLGKMVLNTQTWSLSPGPAPSHNLATVKGSRLVLRPSRAR